jgi:hypothetical protein
MVWLIRKDLWRHRKTCPVLSLDQNKNIKSKSRPAVLCKLLLPTPNGISEKIKLLLVSMANDAVARVVKSDSLILALAEKEFLKLGHDQDQHNYIRAKLRELGRLLIQLRASTNNLDGSLEDYIQPDQFKHVVQAAKTVAGYDENTNRYSTPSLALKIGHSLKKCAKILKARGLESLNYDQVQKVDAFFQLCELRWTDEISTQALLTLYVNKRNRVAMLPLTDDAMKLAKHLKKKANHQTMMLMNKEEGNKTDAWDTLKEILLTQVILFNRRRQGEASKMTIADYEKIRRPCGQKLVLDGLSGFEQELLKVVFRVEVEGKRTRTVPVLFTAKMKENLDLLMENRNIAGVSPHNKFVFARSHYGSTGHIRGSDALRSESTKCGAKRPELLRSTRLRKQIATVSQVANLQENELEMLARFMGHDIRVHREYYRLPEESLEAAKVAKLLLMIEQGCDVAGKKLDEINVTLEEGKYTYFDRINYCAFG